MTIAVERRGPVLVLTMSRPEKRNALTAEMVVTLRDEIRAATDGAILLCGAGSTFCAGQDLSERHRPAGSPPPDLGISLEERYNPLIRAIRSGPVPVVAAVGGIAAGAGATLALACDVVVAASDARFTAAFAKVGLMPDCGGTWVLPRSIGRARALGMALLGSVIDAETAHRWGLVDRIVAPDDLDAAAMGVAERLATMPEATGGSWISH